MVTLRDIENLIFSVSQNLLDGGNKNFMIIGVAGTIGAGKETLTSYFRERGFVYFETRQIIIEELKKLGLEASRKNMQDWADEQRGKFGVEAIMKIMLDRAMKEPEKNYLFDSLRNPGEADFLKENCYSYTSNNNLVSIVQ